MDIAQAKRRENVAEYILYLWQIEDLLRALQFSPEAVFSQLVALRNLGEEQQLVYLQWYMELADLLRQEGKEEQGHLDHTLHLIADLHNLHLQLQQLPAGRRYRAAFARLAPELPACGPCWARRPAIRSSVSAPSTPPCSTASRAKATRAPSATWSS